MSKKLREQFEKETGDSAYSQGFQHKLYNEKYVEWLEQRIEAGQVNEVVNGMAGEVIKMGTMFIDDEHLTGVFVMCAPDEFTRQTTNILYRNVKITPVNE